MSRSMYFTLRSRRLLAVLAGGVLGSGVRAAVSLLSTSDFPWPTLIVNLTGALLLGALVPRLQAGAGPGWGLHLWAIGALGSFTTFSAFGLETVTLIERGDLAHAAGYVATSVAGGLALALVGGRLGARS